MPTVKDILNSMDYGPSPESDTLVRAWLDGHKAGFGHFINGAFVPPQEGAHFAVMDPAKGTVLAHVAQGSAADIDSAVKAARKAFPAWSKLPGHERARYLYAMARQVQKRERFLAVLETLDNGKTIRETRDIDVPLVARHFYHHAGWAQILASEFPGLQPHGVCGQIIPWNFPLLMLAWKVAPALACGNTVVLKPAEFTPLTALAFAEICTEIGLPPGVINIVTGDGSTGAALVAHDDVDKIAFTGSTEVGRAIRTATAGSGKALSLELGGKSPFIVFEDADLDAAVEGVVDAIWFNQGQVCCAGSRLLVQEGIRERFLGKLRRRMSHLRVGDPLDKSMDMGAIVAPVQLERIKALVAQGVAEGATLWQAECPLPAQGSFFPPSVFIDAEPASTIAQEEIFGPVAAMMTFRTPDEAVALANNTAYGLAGSIWSQNIDRALEVAAKLKAGVLWVNSTNMFDAAAPFGGYRESGFGREGGREGLYDYLRTAPVKPRRREAKNLGKEAKTLALRASPVALAASLAPGGIDRTAKLYIGGKQARPDSGYSYAVTGAKGKLLGEAGLGSRKDIRNAVEAAAKATGWSGAAGHNRAQILYFLAENLSARASEFEARLHSFGASAAEARAEVSLSLERLFSAAAYADKYDGRVHATKSRHLTVAMNEPFGVMGLVCPDEHPLLAMISLLGPALAMGNRVVLVPSTQAPLLACDFYQILETSDVPAGVVNIVTGPRDELAKTLADHDEVDALWYAGPQDGLASLERAAAGNLKPVWALPAEQQDWSEDRGSEMLRRATQVKTIWVPYGD